jgi:hypothetical protein
MGECFGMDKVLMINSKSRTNNAGITKSYNVKQVSNDITQIEPLNCL